MTEMIRVLLADDHPTLRLGLRVLLDRADDVEVVGEAEDGEKALALIEALVPDVAVLDCRLPGIEGTEVAREIRRRGLPVRESSEEITLFKSVGLAVQDAATAARVYELAQVAGVGKEVEI